MPLTAGQVLHHERYRIEARLGQGGMGAVYRAWDTTLEIPVAIKENLDASEKAQEQFVREARILARLSHPNLPRVIDHFFIAGQGQYLVMDFVEGEDLDAMLNRMGTLPEPDVLNWISQVCDALAYLHSQPSPIVHRDIKPANIKIRPDGRAMLVDFGIAKVYDPNLVTTIGAKAVTPGYSPPEQYGGASTDPRSDIYALGATLYHLLTGEKPPESVRRMAGIAELQSPRQVNYRVSALVEQVILKAVEVTTERRFQTVEELRGALTVPIVHEENQTVAMTSSVIPVDVDRAHIDADKNEVDARTVKAKAPAPRRPFWWIGVIAVLCVLLVLRFVLVRIRKRTAPVRPTATITVALSPSPENNSAATSTPRPATPRPTSTSLPVGDSDEDVWSDDFEGQLNAEWRWLNEDVAYWSLTDAPGFLNITLQPDGLDSDVGPRNVLLREAPAGAYELETHVLFAPSSNFQFAGLILYQDNNNALQLGRAYCDASEACVGNGIYFDKWQDGEAFDENFATPTDATAEAYLRLSPQGEGWAGYYSEDGDSWQLIGTHPIVFTPSSIGIIASQAYYAETTASFDYVSVRALP